MKIFNVIGKVFAALAGLVITLFMYNKHRQKSKSYAPIERNNIANNASQMNNKKDSENAKEFFEIIEILNKIYD